MTMQKKLLKIRKIFLENFKLTFGETVGILGIMLILSASVGVAAYEYVDYAKNLTAKNQILLYEMALDAYYRDCGVYPSSEQGLYALWEMPISHPIPKNWNGPYVDTQITCDPWGNNFQYKNTTMEKNFNSFEIVSLGPDGTSDDDKKNDIFS